jgi:hypothetical protein
MPVDWLRDSCTYRAIFKKGFVEGFAEIYHEGLGDFEVACERRWLLALGLEWLGFRSAEVRAKLNAIDDLSTLEKLVENLTNQRLKISTWDELFASLDLPSTRRARSR